MARPVGALRTAMFALLVACNAGGADAYQGLETQRAEELARVVDASPSGFDKALTAHGPVGDDEIPSLERITQGWNVPRRRNAVRLLTLNATPAALDVLRTRVKETHDLQEWAYALRGLLDEPDAKALAGAQPGLIDKALDSDDEVVASVGLRAAVLTGQGDVVALVTTQLADADRKVRLAAVEAAAAAGIEAPVRERLPAETDQGVRAGIVKVLARSEVPASITAFKEAMQAADPRAEGDFVGALRQSEASWVRPLFLELAAAPGPYRKSALFALTRGEPTAEVMKLCADLLGDPPARNPDDPAWQRHRTWCEPCESMLSRVEGTQVREDAALAAARAWLESHDG